jgi:hypothetical protein
MAHYEILWTAEEAEELTLDSLARQSGLHPSLIEQFVTLGIVEPSGHHGTTLLFDFSAVLRLRMMGRLRTSLSINYAGAAVILDLVDKIRALQRENQVLQSRSRQI